MDLLDMIARYAGMGGQRDAEEARRRAARGLPPVPTVEQLERNLPAWRADTEARIARGETNGQNYGGPAPKGNDNDPFRSVGDDPFMSYLMESFGGEDPDAAALEFREEMARRQAERDAAGVPRGEIELKRRYLAGGQLAPALPPPLDKSRPPGRTSSYPRAYDGRRVDAVPADVRRQMEGDMAFRELYEPRAQAGDAPFTPEEWEMLREYGYEPTRSPLVLMERHPNGSVTYVHAAAVRDDPRFEWKGYGMHGPQGEGEDEPDPFWREGRRDW